MVIYIPSSQNINVPRYSTKLQHIPVVSTQNIASIWTSNYSLHLVLCKIFITSFAKQFSIDIL